MIVFLGGSTNHPYGHYLAKRKEGMGDISLVGSQKASRGGGIVGRQQGKVGLDHLRGEGAQPSAPPPLKCGKFHTFFKTSPNTSVIIQTFLIFSLIPSTYF